MQRVVEVFNALFPAMITKIAERMIEERSATYGHYTPAQMQQLVAPAMEAYQQDLPSGESKVCLAFWERAGKVRAEQEGARIDDIIHALQISEEVMNAAIFTEFADDPEARAWWLQRLHAINSANVLALSRVFINAREQIIRSQSALLREVSTPMIPVHAGMLVMPLIGAIDSHRASQIMEMLLSSISSQRADVVIIDITGVPVVDTQVANYILHAARAARLLGAQIMLVGISPDIAQTIVQLGVNLSDLITRSNLQDGIEYALRLHKGSTTLKPKAL